MHHHAAMRAAASADGKYYQDDGKNRVLRRIRSKHVFRCAVCMASVSCPALNNQTEILCEIPKLPLLPGTYRINYEITVNGRCVDSQVSARNLGGCRWELLWQPPAPGPLGDPHLRRLQLAQLTPSLHPSNLTDLRQPPNFLAVRLVYICPPGRLRRLQRAREGNVPTEFSLEASRSSDGDRSFNTRKSIFSAGRLRPHLIDTYAGRAFSTDLAGRSFSWGVDLNEEIAASGLHYHHGGRTRIRHGPSRGISGASELHSFA